MKQKLMQKSERILLKDSAGVAGIAVCGFQQEAGT